MALIWNKTFLLCLAFLLIGIVFGYFGNNLLVKQNSSNNSPANQDVSNTYNQFSEFHAGGGYKLINPLYECNTGSPYGTTELLNLKNTLSEYIDGITANNSVTRVAVRFRDLNNGPWFGINDTDDFSPSSLLKTPVMMAYFKKAEKDPSVLAKKITYTTDPEGVITENFPAKQPLEKGKTYTVEQLIERMIMASDNIALRLLEDNIDNADIDQVTIDLGITTATARTPSDFMDVAEYSTLFRVLYYSTYLNKEYSEKALELLSNTEFKQGLVSPIPQDITVAHKFGERELPDGTHQLHDCGIIYYPKHPYLLCIMTKGSDFKDLTQAIQQISSKVYSEAAKMYH